MEKILKYQNIWCILPETLCPQWQKAERFTWPQSTFQLAERKRGLPITQMCRNPVWRGWFCSGFYTTVRANKEAITLHSSLEFSLTRPVTSWGKRAQGIRKPSSGSPSLPSELQGRQNGPQPTLCKHSYVWVHKYVGARHSGGASHQNGILKVTPQKSTFYYTEKQYF